MADFRKLFLVIAILLLLAVAASPPANASALAANQNVTLTLTAASVWSPESGMTADVALAPIAMLGVNGNVTDMVNNAAPAQGRYRTAALNSMNDMTTPTAPAATNSNAASMSVAVSNSIVAQVLSADATHSSDSTTTVTARGVVAAELVATHINNYVT